MSNVPLGLPFLYFLASLPPDQASQDLYRTYMRLHSQAVSAVKTYNDQHPSSVVENEDQREGWSAISYNLAMTRSRMMLCPRRRESAELKVDEPGKSLGSINLNGTILAGTLMVKTRDEYDVLRDDDGPRLGGLLEAVGLPVGVDNQRSGKL